MGSVLIAQTMLSACGGGGGQPTASTATSPTQPSPGQPSPGQPAPTQPSQPSPPAATSPGLTLCASTLEFPLQTVGSASTVQSFTVTNTGTTPLANMEVSLTGTDSASFSQTNNCGGYLEDAASCTVTVTFTPQSSGDKSANIVVSGSGLSAVSVALSGSGGTAVSSTLPASP
jgi:hypothetical protein